MNDNIRVLRPDAPKIASPAHATMVASNAVIVDRLRGALVGVASAIKDAASRQRDHAGILKLMAEEQAHEAVLLERLAGHIDAVLAAVPRMGERE